MSAFLKKIKHLFSGQNRQSDRDSLSTQNEIKKLQMELAERDTTIQKLKDEITRQRESIPSYASEIVAEKLEKIYREIGTGLVYLNRQVYLLASGQPVAPESIQAVIGQMTRVLESNQMRIFGECGEIVQYNADTHAPVTANVHLENGQPVKIVFCGLSYQDKIIKKALVESQNQQS